MSVVWTNFNFFGAIQMFCFHDWWPWTKSGNITMTRKQSNNEWSDGIAAHHTPKIPSANICWKICSFNYFIKKTSSLLIIFQRAKLYTRIITHLCWCSWRTSWRKNAEWRSARVSCPWRTMPRVTGHLQHKRNWPTWTSIVLITPYSPDQVLSEYHLFLGLEK